MRKLEIYLTADLPRELPASPPKGQAISLGKHDYGFFTKGTENHDEKMALDPNHFSQISNRAIQRFTTRNRDCRTVARTNGVPYL
jgi:hypothetical protein